MRDPENAPSCWLTKRAQCGRVKPAKKQKKKIVAKRCKACGTSFLAKNPHHIITRGSLGGNEEEYDVPENLIWLCPKHHNEVHTIGRETFFEKYNIEPLLRKAQEAIRKERSE